MIFFLNRLINILQPCNDVCNCQDTVFSPVCDVTSGTNYFSACRAGCEEPPATNTVKQPSLTFSQLFLWGKTNDNVFLQTHTEQVNCLCATATKLDRIPTGFCKIFCNKLWPFVFLLFLILFVCSVPTVGSVMLIYRY